MLAELIITTSIWWWILTIGGLIIFSVCVYNEYFIWPIAYTILYISVLHFLLGSMFVSRIAENPLNALLYGAGYLGIGTIWSFYKWYLRVTDYRDNYKESKKKYTDNGGDIKEWKRSIYEYNVGRRPVASESKDKIAGWIGYWPFSVIGYFIGEFLVRIVEGIVNRFQGVYKAIENKAYKDLD